MNLDHIYSYEFTVGKNPILNDELAKMIIFLISSIQDYMRERNIKIKAIAISGSFAKGEISYYEHDNKYQILKDIDLVLEISGKISIPRIKNYCMNILKNNFVTDLLDLSYFGVDINIMTYKSNFMKNNTIASLDFRSCMKLIYGVFSKNYVVEIEEISSQSAFHMLWQKLIGILYYLPQNNLNIKKIDRELLIELSKVKAAIGTSILILFDKYTPKYVDAIDELNKILVDKENNIFEENYSYYCKLGIEGMSEKLSPKLILEKSYDFNYYFKVKCDLINAIKIFSNMSLLNDNRSYNDWSIYGDDVFIKNISSNYSLYYDDLVTYNFGLPKFIKKPFLILFSKLMYIFWDKKMIFKTKLKGTPIIHIYTAAFWINKMIKIHDDKLILSLDYNEELKLFYGNKKLINYENYNEIYDKIKTFLDLDSSYLGYR